MHDKTAERIWGVLNQLEAAGLVALTDKGYQGSTNARSRTGITSPNPRRSQQSPREAPRARRAR